MIKTNAENGSGFESRPYQQKGIGSLVNFTKDIVRGNLLNNKEDFEEKYSERGYYETAGLVHMATGTGKTYTVGSALKKILKMRNRFNRLYPDKPFPRLNIVLFTHLIDLVNQFRDDLTKGRKNPAIFDDEIRENLKVVTYHSKADSGNQTEEMETETFTQTNGRQYDKLICSTFQTAAIPGKLDDENDIDIILVDEGHHLADGNNYNTVLEKFYNKGRDGKTPVLIVMTATPNNQTIDLVGESIFHFSLPEYLASPYSPPIDYNLVTNENVTEDEISDLETQRDMIRNIEDIKEKKELLRILKGRMDEFLSRFRTSKDLVENLLKKIGWEKAEATIVFCPSIEIADEVAEIINSKISGIGTEKFAHSYHSRNDANKALDQLDNPNNPCKIIIVVDKVNEGIDMPNIKNVVLWRGTNSPTIFFQQFGRGLRGSDKINVYDYVGGMTNFAWINGIYNDYKKFRGEIEDQNDGDTGESGDRNTKFHLIGGDFSGSQIHKLNLAELGLQISELSEEIEGEMEITKEDVIVYFKENGSIDHWKKMKKRERIGIQIKGAGLFKISNLFGIKGDPVNKKEIWYEFLSKIFSEEITFSKEDVIVYFKENGSIGHWKKMNTEDRKGIKIEGAGLFKISNLFGISGNPVNKKEIWYEFLSKIFNEEISEDKISQDDVMVYFKENGSIDHWKKMKGPVRKGIQIKGNSLLKSSRLFGISGDPADNKKIWYEFLSKIFNEEISEDKISQDDVIVYFKENDSIDHWKKMKKRERIGIQIKGAGLVKISSLFGMPGDPAHSKKIWYEFLSKVFDEKSK